MRIKKDFTFSGGGTVKVHEISSSDLDLFQDMSVEAEKAAYKDVGLSAFAMAYYPVLVACTDNPPPLEESYAKEMQDLDNWYLLCCQLNEDWLGKVIYIEETIKINNKNIVIKSRRPSVDLRLATIEQALKAEKPLENKADEEYRAGAYIAAAAASFGNIPTAYQAKHELGLKEFSLWHKTVRKLIPEWYGDEPAQAEPIVEKKSASKKPAA